MLNYFEVIKLTDRLNYRLVDVEIVPAATTKMPLKNEGWHFNWKVISNQENTRTFVLKIKNKPESIEGILQLKFEGAMVVMDLIEIAPYNIGKNKRYDDVAGCLIAFACRESFKIEGSYQGFLIFESKTDLIEWYREKYGAEAASRQRMFISPDQGIKLIEMYLGR